jgi:rhamnosyl/mannosyltransferase
LLKRADLILTTSPVYARFSKPLQPHLNKCDHLLLSVDEEKFRVNHGRVREIKERYSNRKIVFSLGRYVYYKGYEYLIEAATMLPDDYVVLIGGGGPLKEKYQQLIIDFGVQEKVYMVHDITQEDVGNYYEACDIFCMSSCEKTEAFGIVMLEAMYFSKPIVATNIQGSGVSWVNTHGETGLNVEPKNPRALADAILQIMNNDYDTFAMNSKNRFEAFFTNKQMLAKLHNTYAQLLNREAVIEKTYSVKAS